MTTSKSILLIFIYFILSTVITWYFIAVSPLYDSMEQMVLSCSIAGAKWMIQIVAGYLLLKDQKWEFLYRIGYTCLIGSLILIPYCVSYLMSGFLGSSFFFGSLITSVITMIYLYYKNIIQLGITIFWWLGWLVCLGVAISLQLTVVF